MFQEDPSDLLFEIANGEKRDLKKEYQFFATPDDLADEMVARASIQPDDLILEPSAGQGAIIDSILRLHPNYEVFYCEQMPTNILMLEKKYERVSNVKALHPFNDDFLQLDPGSRDGAVPDWQWPGYDKIIANPPFTKNQDIDHIMKMYSLLTLPGLGVKEQSHLTRAGKLVTLASKHWQISSNKKETAFRDWLKEVDARIEEIPAGRFKQSGTDIACVMITIHKRPKGDT